MTNQITAITAADTSRKLAKIKITVPKIYHVTGDHVAAFPGTEEDATLIVIDLPQGVYAGKSVTVNLHAEKGK